MAATRDRVIASDLFDLVAHPCLAYTSSTAIRATLEHPSFGSANMSFRTRLRSSKLGFAYESACSGSVLAEILLAPATWQRQGEISLGNDVFDGPSRAIKQHQGKKKNSYMESLSAG